MNVGHERTECTDCHRDAPGTLRQQLQANVRYALGQRSTPVDFGAQAVGNQDCLSCHERPFDRHPVFRFTEPRFAEVRKTLAPHRCVSCHLEHSGERVTVANGFCSECHADMDLTDDPLDVSHRELAAAARWDTCLGCHDFHGAHVFETPQILEGRIESRTLDSYFNGAANPYPVAPRVQARQQRVSTEQGRER